MLLIRTVLGLELLYFSIHILWILDKFAAYAQPCFTGVGKRLYDSMARAVVYAHLHVCSCIAITAL